MRIGANSVMLLALALTGTACAQQSGGLQQGGATSQQPSSYQPSRPTIGAPRLTVRPPGEGQGVTGEVPQAILARIRAHAIDRTGASETAIDVIRAEAVVWADGSLGCPEQGMSYTQALVDGYQVVVVSPDEELDYRVGAGGGFRLCERAHPPSGRASTAPDR